MKTEIITLIAALALAGCSSKFDEQDDVPADQSDGDADADADGDEDADGTDPELADADDDGVTIADGDCDDEDDSIYPGAGDDCDGIDNDCDDVIDEGWIKETYYADSDGDEHGNPNRDIEACEQPSGYVTDNTDCDDSDADVYPGAEEVIGDEKDNDCDGDEDERFDISALEPTDETSNAGSPSAIAVDGAGNAHMIFHDSVEGAVLYQRVSPEGLFMDETVLVSAADFDGEYLDAEVDSGGKLHVGYTSSMELPTATLTSLMYTTRSASGVWGEAITVAGGVTGELDRGKYVDLAIQYGSITGPTPIFAYLDNDNGTPMIADMLSPDLCPIFPAGTNYLSGATGEGSGLFTAIDVDAAGSSHVAFFDPNAIDIDEIDFDIFDPELSTPQIQYTNWTWNPDDIIDTLDVGDLLPEYATFEETVSESEYNTISLKARNADQVPCFASQDVSSRDLIFGCREAEGWSIETVASEGVTGAQPSFAINSSDEYFISFYNEGTKDLMLAMKRKEADWEVITVDAEGWVGKHSSIAIGPDNRIHISYYDESNGTLRYAVGY